MGWVSKEGVTSVTPFIMFMIPVQRLLNHMENYKCVMDAKFKYDYTVKTTHLPLRILDFVMAR